MRIAALLKDFTSTICSILSNEIYLTNHSATLFYAVSCQTPFAQEEAQRCERLLTSANMCKTDRPPAAISGSYWVCGSGETCGRNFD